MRSALIASLVVPLGLFGGSIAATAVPGFAGNVVTDATIDFIYELEHFQAYPDYPRVYFSDGTARANDDYPVGDDSNPGTEAQPLRTLNKLVEIANGGHVHIILDAGDDWSLAADWGTNANLIINNPIECRTDPDEDEACVVISASSFSPANRARIDCSNIGGLSKLRDGLFLIGSTNGWVAIENIEFNECPPSLTFGGYDLFRLANVDSPSKLVILNVKTVTGIRGADIDVGQNDFVTGHGAAGGRNVIVALNSEAFIEDSGVGYAADLFDMSVGDQIIIGRSELYSLDSDSGFGCIGGNDPIASEFVVVGHSCVDRTGAGYGNGIQQYWHQSDNSSHHLFVADFTVSGFTGNNGSNDSGGIAMPLKGGGNWNSSMFARFFRVTLTDLVRAIHIRGGGVGEKASLDLEGRCLLIDELSAAGAPGGQTRTLEVRRGVGRPIGDTTNITIDLEGLYDDEPYFYEYHIVGNNWDTAPAAASGSGMPIFTTNSVDSGGDGVDGACGGAECYQPCSTSSIATWTFQRYEIPKIVLGEAGKSLRLGSAAGVPALSGPILLGLALLLAASALVRLWASRGS